MQTVNTAVKFSHGFVFLGYTIIEDHEEKQFAIPLHFKTTERMRFLMQLKRGWDWRN